MADVMMQLGEYQFSINSAAYQNMTRSSEYRWARQNRVGTHDALQFTGFGPENIELDGVIYPHFRGGLGQVDMLRRMAEARKPYTLVAGTGAFLGVWVIESVSEGQTVFAPGGVPHKQEFRMRLARYDGSFFPLPF
ncbi:tail assembly protein [Aliiroseovarius zhejiangensis]|uniref:Tail assembly protein n=1 Tax=Aliiroseovarius zhejiangensis TaxID=1632025 RepID=A0ABQ3IQ04_9RHOB|nr:phage tail protein [Aliiroseovarius zhejiangensis]GHE88215.1 tail assembly protein [Aliiroseovarius zhejiangensis]